jgi:hypothetical protein
MAVHNLWSYGKFVENPEGSAELARIFRDLLEPELFFIFAGRTLFRKIAHHLQE